MQLTSLAALVSIALSVGVHAAPSTFDHAVGLKGTLKRSYSHGVDMSQVSKRAINLVARKRDLNHHHNGKRCVRPKATTLPVNVETPQPTPPVNVESTPQTTPASPAPEPTNNANNNNDAPDDLARQWLNAHNTNRAQHGASALAWSNDLANIALSWGSGCNFKHSGGKPGENLAAQTGSMTPDQAVQMWVEEVKDYDPGNPQPSHFTQVVWKGSTQLGCAIVTCDASKIFPGFTGTAQYGVCEYSPAGNVRDHYAENVQV